MTLISSFPSLTNAIMKLASYAVSVCMSSETFFSVLLIHTRLSSLLDCVLGLLSCKIWCITVKDEEEIKEVDG